jgi:hypothetical protein
LRKALPLRLQRQRHGDERQEVEAQDGLGLVFPAVARPHVRKMRVGQYGGKQVPGRNAELGIGSLQARVVDQGQLNGVARGDRLGEQLLDSLTHRVRVLLGADPLRFPAGA